MELENVFTHAVDGRSRYFDMNAGEDADFVINCHIEVFCIPDDADEDEEDAAYENPELAEKIGAIEGQLVLGTEMMKFGENVYNQCDDAGANTEFIYSALMENGGPLSEDQYFDLFIIDNIDVPEEMFDDIIDKLPEILLTHYHTSPEMLTVYPAPLPYDDTLDEIERNLAYEIHSEVKKQMRGEKDPDEPVYHMTEDQFCIQMGIRRPGESYPAAAKDKAVWERYERSGFEEWKNTRVLYKKLEF